MCPNKEENSIVINISAKSIKDVFDKYGKNSGPLYGSNLRYHIKEKKVDEEIEKSIKTNPNQFWYKNNGLLIIAEKYEINENTNTIKIYNFSLVNGGQTTFMIGETEFEDDFYVLTKIVTTESMIHDDEKDEFIQKVSISTNQQKAIKNEDIISNSAEVRKTAEQFFENGYLLISKRGQKINPEYKSKKERQLKLSDVGQLFLSYFNWEPGSARNQKAKVWSFNTKEVYNSENVSLYIQLRKLYLLVEKCAKKFLKNQKQNHIPINKYTKIYKYGIWYLFMSIISILYILKFQEFRELLDKSKNYPLFQAEWKRFLNESGTFSFKIREENNDIESSINELTNLITKDFFIKNILNNADEGFSFTNYTKVNKNFFNVLQMLFDDYNSTPGKFTNEKVEPTINNIFK